MDQNVGLDMCKKIILKTQNWILPTSDSFPLIMSHFTIQNIIVLQNDPQASLNNNTFYTGLFNVTTHYTKHSHERHPPFINISLYGPPNYLYQNITRLSLFKPIDVELGWALPSLQFQNQHFSHAKPSS